MKESEKKTDRERERKGKSDQDREKKRERERAFIQRIKLRIAQPNEKNISIFRCLK